MSFEALKKKLLNKIWLWTKDQFYDFRVWDTPIVQNINCSTAKTQKKALISYLPISYVADWKNINMGRTQPFEILAMTQVLIELGFCIDVIDCHDTKALTYLNKKKYDLLIGFGEAFYQLSNLHPNAISVLYMTEHHPNVSRREEKKRLDYFYKRHQKRGKVTRTGLFYSDQLLKKTYSHLITMSELKPFEKQYAKPFQIFPTGIINPNYSFKTKNHASTRKSFLWLGSYGAIHKGLDLLLDIFEQRDDITLHIGGFSIAERKLIRLPKKKNIIDHSFIDIKSDSFLKLVQNCSYSILPSCSEGFSTSITTSMMHGLIPVVMNGTGFDRLRNNAIFLTDYRLPRLNARLSEMAVEAPLYLESFSSRVYDFAQENFSIRAYENQFRKIMKTILLKKDL